MATEQGVGKMPVPGARPSAGLGWAERFLAPSLERLSGRVEALQEEIRYRTNALEKQVGTGLDGVEKRIDGVEKRIGSVEGRMGSLETRMGGLENRMGGLETNVISLMNGLGTRMTSVEERVGQLGERVNDKLSVLDRRVLRVEAEVGTIREVLFQVAGKVLGPDWVAPSHLRTEPDVGPEL